MARDPGVDLVFAHNLARYVATGVDPNDAQRLIARIERWEDWCRLWSEEAARHEMLAKEAADKGGRQAPPKPMCKPRSIIITASTCLQIMPTSGRPHIIAWPDAM